MLTLRDGHKERQTVNKKKNQRNSLHDVPAQHVLHTYYDSAVADTNTIGMKRLYTPSVPQGCIVTILAFVADHFVTSTKSLGKQNFVRMNLFFCSEVIPNLLGRKEQ